MQVCKTVCACHRVCTEIRHREMEWSDTAARKERCMFIGHYAVGFGLKKVEPKLSLGTLVLGATLLDILFGIFMLTGVEHARIVPGASAAAPFEFYDYPISHSALGAVSWSFTGFLVYWLWPGRDRAQRKRPAAVFALAIFSHYVLDVISHTPDMPLLGSASPKLGLSLWDSLPATIAVEIALFIVGIVLYLRARRELRPAAKYGLAALILILTASFLGGSFGPPPPNMTVIGIMLTAGQAAYIAFAYWIDKNTR